MVSLFARHTGLLLPWVLALAISLVWNVLSSRGPHVSLPHFCWFLSTIIISESTSLTTLSKIVHAPTHIFLCPEIRPGHGWRKTHHYTDLLHLPWILSLTLVLLDNLWVLWDCSFIPSLSTHPKASLLALPARWSLYFLLNCKNCC